MAHHFDTQRSKEDPRLNICDFYLFDGSPGRTTMVMTTSADVGLSSPDSFHPEGLYSFRFQRNGAAEDLIFTFRFGEPRHTDGEEHEHVQDYTVFKSIGVKSGTSGDTLLTGVTGIDSHQHDVSAFVGMVPELWAADAIAFRTALRGVIVDDRFDRSAFERRENFFARRNVMAIVLEVPNEVLGDGKVHVWATISLFGHAPEVQICRFGYPLFTHLFLANPTTPELVDAYHASVPTQDRELFGPAVAGLVARLAAAAGALGAQEYGDTIAATVCPSMLPYEPGAAAAFRVDYVNGRPLLDDAYDVMWTLAANQPVSDGVAPDPSRVSDRFPYYGTPYSKSEQSGLAPLQAGIGYEA